MVFATQTLPLNFAARRRSASRTSSAARSVVHCTCRVSAKVDQRTSAAKIELFSSSHYNVGGTANSALAKL